jgi:glycosyltransferase involved in cell wall biosynthesis
MKILYHHRTRSEDAQGIHIQAMVRAFRDLGHEVTVVSLVESAGGEEEKTRGQRWGSWMRRTPPWLYEVMSLSYNLYGYRRLSEAIRRTGADLIYERYALNTLCGVWASRRFRIPLIVEVNAPLVYEQEQLGQLAFRRLAAFSERWICCNSVRTVVVSRVLADYLAAEGVPASQFEVLPNGIDPREFHPQVSAEPLRQRYQLEGRVVVGFAGWFRKWHGLEMLVRVMHEAGFFQRGVSLLLVGTGPAYADVERYVRDHGIRSAVIFAGAVPRAEMPGHVAAMDIAVQPSAVAYACPMKIFEYMGMARCIVAPDQPNIREILDDGKTALLFEPNRPASLGAALQTAVECADLRSRLGQRAHQTVFERRYLWSANGERIIAGVRYDGQSAKCPLPMMPDAPRSADAEAVLISRAGELDA